MSDAVLTKQVAEHVMLVTINRPDARNAVNGDVAQGHRARGVRHREGSEHLGGDPHRRGRQGVLRRRGPEGGLGRNRRRPRTKGGGFAGFVHQPRTKPWIAAVNGFALAGGTEIALACDLIVAIEDAAFGLPEVKRGLVAGAGGLYRLPRALPKAIALELIMTGAHFDAKRAFEHGLVNRLVPRDQLMPEALKLAAAICENAPLAVRASLSVAKTGL